MTQYQPKAAVLKRTNSVRKKFPRMPTTLAPETTPVKYTTYLMNTPRSKWYNGLRHDFKPAYSERHWLDTWPARRHGWEKGSRTLLRPQYSPEALQEALDMIPEYFEVRDVPRPPQRIKAVSEGVVNRWYTNYWTLHSLKYQTMLAGVPWRHGERFRPRTNWEEPYHVTDFEESKAIRDQRSRFMNINRSLVGMTRKMKDAEEEVRYVRFRKHQDSFWSARKILINRVKGMHNQGLMEDASELPVKTFNIRAFVREE